MEPNIQATQPSPIEEFIKYYNNSGYLAYEKLGERTHQILVSELEKQNIKHEIFDRGKEGSNGGKAKAPSSVRQTVMRRQRGRGKVYQTVEEIISDMHDLAGLRIALYYPNDFTKVEEMIKTRFVEVKPPQDWPDENFGSFTYPTLDRGSLIGRNSRFPGYFARHFRIKLHDQDVTEPAIQGKTLEIQVMSVLMHAWSKMYQELIYKPKPGVPQADEDVERLLDISNGIIIAGEQVLRQIQINLDKKRLLGRQPFKNEHDVWSYLTETFVCNENNLLSPGQRLWVKECRQGPYSHTLYEALCRVEFNNPEKLEILVKQALESQFGPEGLQQPSLSFIEAMIVEIVNNSDFELYEAKTLDVSLSDDDLAQSQLELARKARYQALIICSALRQQSPDSLHLFWQDDYFNHPDIPHPSGKQFLSLIHPHDVSLSTKSLNKMVISTVEEFCARLIRYQEPSWKLHCSLARLGYISVTQNASDCLQQSITACPLGLIALLNYSAKYDNASLKESLAVLEAAARDGFLGRIVDEMSNMFPASFCNYRCPKTLYVAALGMDGRTGAGQWTVEDRTGVSGEMVWVDPLRVRKYLDRLGSEDGVENACRHR
ncbi:hypothetical protein QBC38DRAFT_489875 [Podospora fimiseda]|uniref:RelA/SpoT domain-containing protein n=1 Tax=Podospora fimiseda TaxID=252190 RepID=A0AAN7BFS5_9PEZI|nr:hypothetical protein QBC38DRAFT_489875 [Podospora fimiseda]